MYTCIQEKIHVYKDERFKKDSFNFVIYEHISNQRKPSNTRISLVATLKGSGNALSKAKPEAFKNKLFLGPSATLSYSIHRIPPFSS